MNRLIVFTTLVTLLASLSGCSIVNGRRTESCDRPAARRLLPRVSLPWRRAQPRSMVGAVGAFDTSCPTCNEGVMAGETVVSGTIPTQALYDPSTVFNGSPVYHSGSVEGITTPTPSPEMGGGIYN